MRLFILMTGLLFVTACVSTPKLHFLAELDAPENSQRLVSVTPDLALEFIKQTPQQPLLVEFSAEWCEPCQDLVEPLQKLAAESQGRYRVINVDVTSGLEVMEKFGLAPKLPAFLLQVPGMQDPILRYGSGEPFDQIAHFLKNDEAPRTIPLPFRPLKKPQAYRAMLLAGSADNANFLQEVYWNYSWLLQKGYQAEEIGCFYARPDLIQYGDDREQFEAMKPLLESCHPVRHKEFLESMRLSLKARPENFYLYVTAHGAAPIPKKYAENFKKNCLAQAPSLALDQTPPDCISSQGLTVDDLAGVMKDTAATRKFLVLQGCYTGGFISSRDDPKTAPSPLARLPNIQILTASAANKASFGCNAGAKATFFGSAYSVAVIENKQKLEAMNWPHVYQDVIKEVSKLEKQMKLGRRDASQPQFFSN